MTARSICAALIFGTALAACDSGGTIAAVGKTTADVRVVNASTTGIDMLQGTSVSDAAIAFGDGAACQTVDIISHGLSVRPAGIRTSSTPLPSFSANERYLVLVTGTASSLQPTPFRNSFTPSAGKGAIRLINVNTVGSYDIYVTAPGASLTAANATNVVPGTASTYFDVLATAQQVRLTTNGSTSVAFDVGNVTVGVGGRAVIVLAPPASGGTAPRPFVVLLPANGGC